MYGREWWKAGERYPPPPQVYIDVRLHLSGESVVIGVGIMSKAQAEFNLIGRGSLTLHRYMIEILNM